jgi:hypothetical protein
LQKSPLTDKHLGVTTRGYDIKSFSEIRAKAKEELEERYRKTRRDKSIQLPKFQIDDEIVVVNGYSNPVYTLVKILDWEDERWNNFSYYGIILKTTSKDLKNRIGRLLKVHESTNFWGHHYANIKPEDVKWEQK